MKKGVISLYKGRRTCKPQWAASQSPPLNLGVQYSLLDVGDGAVNVGPPASEFPSYVCEPPPHTSNYKELDPTRETENIMIIPQILEITV